MVLWDCTHHGFMGFVEMLASLKATHPGNNDLLLGPYILSAGASVCSLDLQEYHLT